MGTICGLPISQSSASLSSDLTQDTPQEDSKDRNAIIKSSRVIQVTQESIFALKNLYQKVIYLFIYSTAC